MQKGDETLPAGHRNGSGSESPGDAGSYRRKGQGFARFPSDHDARVREDGDPVVNRQVKAAAKEHRADIVRHPIAERLIHRGMRDAGGEPGEHIR